MSDLVIIRRRDRAHIRGESKRGSAWITDNLDDSKTTVEIALDLTDDMAETMRQAGLDVEIV